MDLLTVCTPEGGSLGRDLSAPLLAIGRSSTDDRGLDGLNVSRLHAQTDRRPDGSYIVDVGGKNGTFLNERPISAAAQLKPSDRVRLGSTILIFSGVTTSAVEFSNRPLRPVAGGRGWHGAASGAPHVLVPDQPAGIDQHCSGSPWQDDIALLIVKRSG